MTILNIVITIVMAIYFTSADIGCTRIRRRFGFHKGLACWIIGVASPIIAGLIIMPKVTLGAMCISTGASFFLFRKQQRNRDKAMTSEYESYSETF